MKRILSRTTARRRRNDRRSSSSRSRSDCGRYTPTSSATRSYSCGSGFIHSTHDWTVDSTALEFQRSGDETGDRAPGEPLSRQGRQSPRPRTPASWRSPSRSVCSPRCCSTGRGAAELRLDVVREPAAVTVLRTPLPPRRPQPEDSSSRKRRQWRSSDGRLFHVNVNCSRSRTIAPLLRRRTRPAPRGADRRRSRASGRGVRARPGAVGRLDPARSRTRSTARRSTCSSGRSRRRYGRAARPIRGVRLPAARVDGARSRRRARPRTRARRRGLERTVRARDAGRRRDPARDGKRSRRDAARADRRRRRRASRSSRSGVRDLERSIDFYRAFGFRDVARFPSTNDDGDHLRIDGPVVMEEVMLRAPTKSEMSIMLVGFTIPPPVRAGGATRQRDRDVAHRVARHRPRPAYAELGRLGIRRSRHPSRWRWARVCPSCASCASRDPTARCSS